MVECFGLRLTPEARLCWKHEVTDAIGEVPCSWTFGQVTLDILEDSNELSFGSWSFQIFPFPQKPHRSVPCLDQSKLFTKGSERLLKSHGDPCGKLAKVESEFLLLQRVWAWVALSSTIASSTGNSFLLLSSSMVSSSRIAGYVLPFSFRSSLNSVNGYSLSASFMDLVITKAFNSAAEFSFSWRILMIILKDACSSISL